MKSRLVAIVGSLDEGRVPPCDPPLRNTASGRTCAQKLGEELAARGYRLMVFSADPRYAEGPVVSGYVASGKARDCSIRVVYPAGQSTAADFPERKTHVSAFHLTEDSSPDWEIAFYRALLKADAAVLIGGGRSTELAGTLCLVLRKPLLALSSYGGAAERINRSLVPERDLVDEAGIDAMRADGESVVREWGDALDR